MAQVFVGYDSYGISGVDTEYIQFIFDMILSHTACPKDSEMGLVITSDEHNKSLNSQYRGKNKTTNVLSFSNDLVEENAPDVLEEDKNYLGDVYISYQQLNREAAQLKISLKERFVQLFIHGALHLIGFDHEEDVAAEAYENLEDKIFNSVI